MADRRNNKHSRTESVGSTTSKVVQHQNAVREIQKNRQQKQKRESMAGLQHTRYPTGPAPDPETTERRVKEVPPPATFKPTEEQFVDPRDKTKPNVEFLRKHFYQEGRLTEEQALWIIDRASTILNGEPNLIYVNSPVTICGDIHGQYYDLMKLFGVGGSIEENKYLFLGDYVDRGDFGIECLFYLYALKICYPQRIALLRGNHECRHLTEHFTFKRECLHKYGNRVYEACIASFCTLPVAALVDGKFFCVHGGLSPQLTTLNDIQQMNRFVEPESHGLLCDLLWSDPVSCFGNEEAAGIPPKTMFMHNQTRGCSYFYTYYAVYQFLERNNLLSVIRGHEAQSAGYSMHKKGPKRNFPSLITIFSAPNYLDAYHNQAAVMKYGNKNVTIRQFNYSPHPYWLPNFMDAFTWSLPFVGEKITEMLLALLKICTEEELEERDEESERAISAAEMTARRQVIQNKIMAVGRMQRVWQILRSEAESATELHADDAAITAAHSRMNVESLGVQGDKIARSIKTFDDARRSDLINERMPVVSSDQRPMLFATPSMYPVMRKSSAGNLADEERSSSPWRSGTTMEEVIRKVLEDADMDEFKNKSTVDLISERIAQGRPVTGRPGALKRHETAL